MWVELESTERTSLKFMFGIPDWQFSISSISKPNRIKTTNINLWIQCFGHLFGRDSCYYKHGHPQNPQIVEGSEIPLPPKKIGVLPLKPGWWFQPLWKILVKLGSSSPSRDKNKKCLKPPPRFCFRHLMKGLDYSSSHIFQWWISPTHHRSKLNFPLPINPVRIWKPASF